MFPRASRNRGVVFPNHSVYTPSFEQVITGSADAAVATWIPGTGGRGTFGIEYQAGGVTLIESAGSAPDETVTFPRGLDLVTSVGLQLTSGTGDRYAAIAGASTRARLVYPTVASPLQTGAWVNSAAVAPPAWTIASAPALISSGSDGGQGSVVSGNQTHIIDVTIGATLSGYISTGYSGRALRFVVDRTRNGVTQAQAYGYYTLQSYFGLALPVHPDDGATWSYQIYVWTSIAAFSGNITNTMTLPSSGTPPDYGKLSTTGALVASF